MFILQVVVVLVLIGVGVVETILQSEHDIVDEASARARSVAETFASSPDVIHAMDDPDPSAVLQPKAEKARKNSEVGFIVVTTPQGIRLTHPRPGFIGKKFIGTIAPAQRGQVVVETLDDTDGRFVQAVVPVMDRNRLVALVAAGLRTGKVPTIVNRQLPLLLCAVVAALLVALGGTALVTSRLRRQTRGLDPAELARMYEHHDAVLHTVKEGVVILDGKGCLLLANDEARRLLSLPQGNEGLPIADLGIEPRLAHLMMLGRTVVDKVISVGERLLVVNYQSTDQNGGPAGSVATFRDTTELRVLGDQAESARRRLKLLYDAGSYVGRSLDIAQTAQELADFAVTRFADFVTVDLAKEVLSGGEPTASSGMHRAAVSGIKENHPLYPLNTMIRFASFTPQSSGFHSGSAVLVPSLAESTSWRQQDSALTGEILAYGIHSLITAPLLARGETLGMASFFRSEKPEPFDNDDLIFAEELAVRAAISIDNARRFTREHTLAVTLQRSLLPHNLPCQNALEVAHRYLPAQADAGGDWFDIVPLPGARVALVVGDVVGHGLEAAANMGRLRTAVHNFSSLDLPPDEILRHLDELVTRTEMDGDDRPNSHGLIGATCLYAIYDPVTRYCSVALAGHPSPVFIMPGRTVEHPELSVGPPLGLGLGGLPYEATQLYLPEGSDIVLFTDGLIENRSQGIDEGLNALYNTLADIHGTPDQICDRVLTSALPDRPHDDIALMVARTIPLSPECVAEWAIEPDPAVVASLRKEASNKLNEWNLREKAFTTELIVSELATNAIRYSTGTVRVRLIRDSYLICEVYDGSSTSPHLRRAATTDEGGRGLFLVSQLSRHWGVRYTDEGKLIWCEQSLTGD
ncbi:histidine kinase [Streptomyces sp. NBRC 13847]|uniref:SpoIIE family protein phosphatase n=1 Tax=Streptomyces TaxID=1883 RepID=UPI0024A050DF|nr:SpoIIE family protein phosphatase [Streptomyces sp. NBRC 13847]GLW19912.1 histidine kinase [Streptomyces sp. NBRC 13847]